MTPTRPAPIPGWFRWAALAILLVTVGTRFYALDAESFWLDELHSLEGAYGYGVDHQLLPTGRLLVDPPHFTRPATARPVWAIWTTLDRVSHPPGSFVVLRLWVDLFGDSEAAVRSLSACCSAAAVVGLFLAVRTWGSVETATWAAALMAVAGPQVHAARDGRPYAMLTLLATAALWCVGRTVAVGPAWRRTVALGFVLLAMLLTHYFAVAAAAALGVYAVVGTRGATRRHLAGAVTAAGLAFALVWGPYMWRQLGDFSTADRSAAFLAEAGPGHARATLWRLATLPASYLADRRPIPPWYAAVAAVAYAAAAVVTARRRWPAVWPVWYVTVPGMLLALDLTRSTAHLNYLRYPILMAVPVYAALAALPAVHHPVGRAVTATAVAFAAWSLPLVYAPQNEDFRALGDAVRERVPPAAPIVFAGPAARYSPQILYLAVAHYGGPRTGPVAILGSPADPPLLAQLSGRQTVWMVADPDVRLARQWLPGYHLAAGQSWPVVGSLLRMTRDGPSD